MGSVTQKIFKFLASPWGAVTLIVVILLLGVLVHDLRRGDAPASRLDIEIEGGR